MTISDQTTKEVIRLYRPLTCQGCCCSALYPYCTQVRTSNYHCTKEPHSILSMLRSDKLLTKLSQTIVYMLYASMQALTVSVNGETVGTVRERATWLYPVYHVFDSVGNQVLATCLVTIVLWVTVPCPRC